MRGTIQSGATHYLKDGNEGTYDLCDLAADTLLPSHHRDLMKYYWRHDRKDGLKDIKKAITYLDSIVYNMTHSGKGDVPVQPSPMPALEKIHGDNTDMFVLDRLSMFLRSNGISGKKAGIMTIMYQSAFYSMDDTMYNIIRHELELLAADYKEEIDARR